MLLRGKWLFLSCLTAFIFFSCKEEKQKPIEDTPPPAPAEEARVNVPQFNADSSFYYVKKQVEFGPRVPNTRSHDECRKFLVAELKKAGLKVEEQKATVTAFDNTRLNITNIIGSYNESAAKRILLFAHWDTRPFADQDDHNKGKPIPGANDGGSGVGVLLEVANKLNGLDSAIGIDIIFFDGEDYGQPEETITERKSDTYCLGSQYWGRTPHKPGYKAEYGILLDMVGYPNATFTMEGTSMQYAPHVVQKVWDRAHKAGFGKYFLYQQTAGVIDDHLYVNRLAKIPSIDIIHHDPRTPSNFGSYWHTHEDNLSNVDPATLKAVGQTILEVIYREK